MYSVGHIRAVGVTDTPLDTEVRNEGGIHTALLHSGGSLDGGDGGGGREDDRGELHNVGMSRVVNESA